MIPNYVKSYSVDNGQMAPLLMGPCFVEEKIDGSQCGFGVIDGALRFRSKSQEISTISAGMFQEGINALRERRELLTPGYIYRGEYLSRPKHNVLRYDRVPLGHIMVFDIETGPNQWLTGEDFVNEVRRINLEPIPLLGFLDGNITPDRLKPFLDTDSILGGCKVEGVVVKRHGFVTGKGHRAFAKLVSDRFKERGAPKGPKKDWIARLAEEFGTTARIEKAFQHLRDAGKLEGEPKDIGPIILEFLRDLEEEYGEHIQQQLLHHASREFRRAVTNNIPVWYKMQLAVPEAA